jgi:HNH endonuclease
MISPPIIVEGKGRRKVFPPVGRCIYCGTSTGELTDEHIIPLALGGNMVLPQASCRDCAKITGQIEGFNLEARRGIFGPLRLRLKLPTRHPKKRPENVEYDITDSGGKTRTISVSAYDVPLAFFGFITGLPGILVGRKPQEGTPGKAWFRYNTEQFC